MSEIQILVLVIAAVVVLAIAWSIVRRRRRSRDLQARFGPEYKRVVQERGDRQAAEAELEARRERVEELRIRPLGLEARDRYAGLWRRVQARFVDEPREAIANADQLVGRVMEERGYPVSTFDQRLADISVDHADFVGHYRIAHGIASSRDPADSSTESLRQAMVHYRALFEALLGEPVAAGAVTAASTDQTAAPSRPPSTSSPTLSRRR